MPDAAAERPDRVGVPRPGAGRGGPGGARRGALRRGRRGRPRRSPRRPPGRAHRGRRRRVRRRRPGRGRPGRGVRGPRRAVAGHRGGRGPRRAAGRRCGRVVRGGTSSTPSTAPGACWPASAARGCCSGPVARPRPWRTSRSARPSRSRPGGPRSGWSPTPRSGARPTPSTTTSPEAGSRPGRSSSCPVAVTWPGGSSPSCAWPPAPHAPIGEWADRHLAGLEVYDDLAPCTGGYLVGLAAGNDAAVFDPRPLLVPGHLAAHPYDMASLVVTRAAGAIVEALPPGPLDVPLDCTTPVAWAGYADAGVAARLRPAPARCPTAPDPIERRPLTGSSSARARAGPSVPDRLRPGGGPRRPARGRRC